MHVLRVEISHVCGKLMSDAIDSRASERARNVCVRKEHTRKRGYMRISGVESRVRRIVNESVG